MNIKATKYVGGNVQTMQEKLEELLKQELLTTDEVKEIKNENPAKPNPNNEITIGSKTISFKIEDYEAPELPLGDETWTGDVNSPKLAKGMTIVAWDSGNNEITPKTKEEWYNYENNKWANAKTEDGSYFVWIPRYEYKITPLVGTDLTKAGTIDVKFIQTTTTTASPGYIIHPAFTDNIALRRMGCNIAGIWVAKYEMSMEKNGVATTPVNVTTGNIAISQTVKMVNRRILWRSRRKYRYNLQACRRKSFCI